MVDRTLRQAQPTGMCGVTRADADAADPLAADAPLAVMRAALQRTPHARGDHTDLCRHHNAGIPPLDAGQCRCHVAAVARALATPTPRADALLALVRAAREACQAHARSATHGNTPQAADPTLATALTALQAALNRLEEVG
ncbi:MAG: hypothetical protein HQL66_03825 [Magnetococcales bacterium]|nr:hypothetical protein [Magnetococcales bacterium]